jgi:hypothetical protein
VLSPPSLLNGKVVETPGLDDVFKASFKPYIKGKMALKQVKMARLEEYG